MIDLSAVEEVEAIYKEIDIQRSLHHPNTLSLLSIIELNKEKYFLTMPIMSGGNLLDFINDWEEGVQNLYSITNGLKGDFGLPVREARTIFKQILLGLKYMHDSCIAHCDMKPENGG